ncbi:UNVERIFIED_CONTAM: hypothetical protein GTU68_032184 [Idotea baltica]|nr:hypothetical protein [Idotea baltica]
MTGLANRSKFIDQLEQSLRRIKRSRDGVAVLLIDMDEFKAINDSLGHPAGDRLICEVAERLVSNTRETDCVARLGGDEFAILQSPASRGEDVSALAERLLNALDRPFDINGQCVQAVISIGVALAPNDGTTAEQLVKHADLALHRAKADGRGCCRFFEAKMDHRIRLRRQTVVDLMAAIDNNEFEVYYQPLIDAHSGKLMCFEALLRWNHPTRGQVPPDEFLQVAEDTGIIESIGAWVIRQACSDAVNWPEEINVAVNVSALQFRDNGLIHSIYQVLADTGLSPNRLELEIVESIVLRDSTEVIHALNQLHRRGIKIVMDDFGTGYSSLSYLRTFPFDKIKLDKSFVQDAVNCEDALAIVQAVATLGKCLGMELTAEGVETQQQLDCVVAEGYGRIQGFLYDKPKPFSHIRFDYGEATFSNGGNTGNVGEQVVD